MYADDLIVLSASMRGLQSILHHCSLLSLDVKLSFNCKKCICFVAGPASKFRQFLPPMFLNNQPLVWADSFKYLGVSFTTGVTLNVDINKYKRSFYASCNNILCTLRNCDEIVKLFLCEICCMVQYTVNSVAPSCGS